MLNDLLPQSAGWKEVKLYEFPVEKSCRHYLGQVAKVNAVSDKSSL
jgi:hypothetical protein